MGFAYAFAVALSSCIGDFLFGYDSGVISSRMVQTNFVRDIHASAEEEGAIVSVFAAGAFFGAGLAIAMIWITSIIFSLSFGPLGWTYQDEIFSDVTIRAKGNAYATMSNWAFNVLFAQISPPALSAIGWKFYILFVCLNSCSAVVLYLFYPETKGVHLELANTLYDDVPSLPMKKTHTDTQNEIHEDNLQFEMK